MPVPVSCPVHLTPLHCRSTYTISRRLFTALLGAVLLSACQSEDMKEDLAVGDREGVFIWSNQEVQFEDLPLVKIGDEPSLVIGDRRGERGHDLYMVGPGILTEDGTLIIPDWTSKSLRYFDSSGKLIREVGGKGEGPGEFEDIGRISRSGGDTISIWDNFLGRHSYFDGEGNFVTSVNYHDEATYYESAGLFSDGSFVLKALRYERQGPNLASQYTVFIRVSEAGVLLDSFPAVDGPPHKIGASDGMLAPPHFSPSVLQAVVNDLLWVGYGAVPTLRAFSRDAQLVAVLHWEDEPVRVRDEDFEAYRELRISSANPAYRAGAIEIVDFQDVSEFFPVYDRIVADAGGRLWVRRYRKPLDEPGSRWWIFDGSGNAIARAELPDRVRIMEIGEDYILLIIKNETDIERVEVRSISFEDF